MSHLDFKKTTITCLTQTEHTSHYVIMPAVPYPDVDFGAVVFLTLKQFRRGIRWTATVCA